MPRGTITFDAVRKIGLALPGVEASIAWGAPALKIRGKLMACVPSYRRRVEIVEELVFVIDTDNFGAVVERMQRYGGRTPLVSSQNGRRCLRFPPASS
jgi:hypothetical protein